MFKIETNPKKPKKIYEKLYCKPKKVVFLAPVKFEKGTRLTA